MKTLYEHAKTLLDKPLSSQDILDLCQDKINIIKYTDLDSIQHIDDILRPFGACIILYQSAPRFGHWTLLMRRECKDGQRVLEFFDSYGITLDDEFKWIHYVDGAQLPNKFKYLTGLILASGYDGVVCNNYQLQRRGKEVQTCGRWCVLRYLMRDQTLPEFVHYFINDQTNGIDPDVLTCFVTGIMMDALKR